MKVHKCVALIALLFAVAACSDQESSSGGDSNATSSQETQSSETATQTQTQDTPSASSEPAASTESAASDDGNGAMDGATETSAMSSSEVSQDAIDACIDGLRQVEGTTGGTVVSTEFSEANSLVMLQDGNGTTWRCLVSNDGTNPYLEAADASQTEATGGEDTATADDGGGAMDGATNELGPLADFVGARGGQAEGGLRALGFEDIRSEGLVTYWFNRATGTCAQITTSDGVYSDIKLLPAEDC